MNRAMTLTDWCILLAASVLIGSSFLFVNITIQEISPFTAAALRALSALPACWVLMRVFGARWPRARDEWSAFLLLGLMTGAVPYGAVAWGQQHIESGMAGILFGTMPILSVLMAPFFLAEESFTRKRLMGGATGLVGIVVLTGPSV
jgi:drug/metabolite transporter (DMT)-like permease